MPRTGRGGRVQGTVGVPHPQRTDLMAAEPVSVAPGQEYGQRAQQQAAQRAVPLAPPSGPQAPVPGPGEAGGPPGAPTPARQAPMIGQTPVSGPGIVPFLHPSNRPNEPVTAGLPTGPGPGPEALTGIGAMAANQTVEQGTLKNLLGSLAAAPVSSTAVRDLAAVAGA